MTAKTKAKTGDLDLFGFPADQIRDRWGRPSFAKTKENQMLVAALRAKDWSQERIARYMGTSEKTLRKHFSRELRAGRDMIEGDATAVMLHRMRQGNVSAARHFISATRAPGIVPLETELAAPVEAVAPEEKLGKKARLEKEAKNPRGRWAGRVH